MLPFREITLEDKPMVEHCGSHYNYHLCERCFVDLFMWRSHYNTQICFKDGFMLVKMSPLDGGHECYLAPVGQGDLGAALESVRETRTFEKLPRAEGSFEELLERSGATVLAEGTPTNLKTGEPGLTHIRAALSRGISVTTTNKGPIALAFDELTELAKANGAQLSYEGVVMSGTPLIDMMKNGIAGCSVVKLEGILNGTTNFMLTKMAEGAEYGAALAEAQN